jgi:hypothetical protein
MYHAQHSNENVSRVKESRAITVSRCWAPLTLIVTVSFSKTSTVGPGYCPFTSIADFRSSSGMANGVTRCAGRFR